MEGIDEKTIQKMNEERKLIEAGEKRLKVLLGIWVASHFINSLAALWGSIQYGDGELTYNMTQITLPVVMSFLFATWIMKNKGIAALPAVGGVATFLNAFRQCEFSFGWLAFPDPVIKALIAAPFIQGILQTSIMLYILFSSSLKPYFIHMEKKNELMGKSIQPEVRKKQKKIVIVMSILIVVIIAFALFAILLL